MKLTPEIVSESSVATAENGYVVTMTTPIDVKVVRNLLCCAFEGGYTDYWIGDIRVGTLPEGTVAADFKLGGSMQDPKNYWHPHQLVPTTEGGSLRIHDYEMEAWYTLDKAAIERGLAKISNCPGLAHHWSNVMLDNADAETGDVFIQCCIHGEVVYG